MGPPRPTCRVALLYVYYNNNVCVYMLRLAETNIIRIKITLRLHWGPLERVLWQTLKIIDTGIYIMKKIISYSSLLFLLDGTCVTLRGVKLVYID